MYINSWYSLGGKDESKSNINNANRFLKDNYDGEKNVEDVEIKMIDEVINVLSKSQKNLTIIGGNLSNQLSTMEYALKNYCFPFIGIYSACSTFIEGLILAKLLNSDSIVISSSHCLASERQFRFPNEYESLKKNYCTNTMTACVGILVSNNMSKYYLGNYTIGRVVNSTINDVNNMGAVMAIACADTLYNHLTKYRKESKYYDYIVTGDLGFVGLNILKSLLKEKYNLEPDNIIDAGSLIYKEKQKKQAGASGPTVLPYFLVNFLFKENVSRILLIGTGSLHNPTLINQKKEIPSIAHAIEVEVMNV